MNNKYPLMVIILLATIFMGCKRDRKADILESNSNKINKTCPVRVDSLVMLDSTHYNRNNNSMTYYYTTYGELDDSVLINQNYKSIEKTLADAIENSVDMRKYKEYEVTLIYQYNSQKRGNVLATFTMPTKQKENKVN